MPDRQEVIDAIRASWSAATSAEPNQWSRHNPAKGQCDVSSFVAWEYLGGDLVLSQVFVDGEMTEHHYSNRIDGSDLDLTREQFTGTEEITEVSVLENDDIQAKQATLRTELSARIELMRSSVRALLNVPA